MTETAKSRRDERLSKARALETDIKTSATNVKSYMRQQKQVANQNEEEYFYTRVSCGGRVNPCPNIDTRDNYLGELNLDIDRGSMYNEVNADRVYPCKTVVYHSPEKEIKGDDS